MRLLQTKLLLFYSALTLPAVVGEPRAAQNEYVPSDVSIARRERSAKFLVEPSNVPRRGTILGEVLK